MHESFGQINCKKTQVRTDPLVNDTTNKREPAKYRFYARQLEKIAFTHSLYLGRVQTPKQSLTRAARLHFRCGQ